MKFHIAILSCAFFIFQNVSAAAPQDSSTDSAHVAAAPDSTHAGRDSTTRSTDSLHRAPADSTAATVAKAPDNSSVADSARSARDTAGSAGNAVNKLEKSVVVGSKEGQASALNKEKNSDNLKNVIDAELISKLPDQSTADALQRVPGISVDRDQGEGHYVMIRGTEARLSTVTINGQAVASPDGSTRAVPLNVIPADQLAEIEVTKVLMPEMDADAIGGTVNLITNSAKDSVLRVKASVVPGYEQLSDQPVMEGSLSAGKRFLDNALGIFAGGSYSYEDRESQGIATTWDPDIVLNTGDTTESHIAGKHLFSLMFRDYQNENTRIAGNSKIDYRLSPEASLYLSGSYNFYDTHEYRRSLYFDMHNGNAVTIGDAAGSGENLEETVPITRSLKDSDKKQSISNVTIGGTTELPVLKLDGAASYSMSQTDQPHDLTSSFGREDETILFNPNNGDNPQYEAINSSTYQLNELLYNKEVFKPDTTVNDMSKFLLNDLELKKKEVSEASLSGQLNATSKPTDIFLDGSLEFKTGVKGAEHTKDQSLVVTSYDDSDGFKSPNLSTELGSFSSGSFYNGQYVFNDMPDPAKMWTFVNQAKTAGTGPFLYANTANHKLEEDPQTYSATDRNGAGFVQAKLKWDQFSLIGGLRLEYTSLHYSGLKDTALGYNDNLVYSSPITMFRSFFFPLPMVLGCFSPTEKMNARVSYTHSFSRPNWSDMLPQQTFTTDDGELLVNEGNPDLKPTQAHNVDLSWEYFPTSQDMVSLGGFYKRMQDYVFDWEGWYDQAIHSPWAHSGSVSSGSHSPIDATTKINGDHADLAGVEFNLMQKFNILPGFLNGFGINGNYTYTWSQTQLPGYSKITALPGQSDHVANVSLFYEKYGFSARFALNFQSASIYELKTYINTSSGLATPYPDYTDDHTEFDCAFSQRFPGHVTAVLEFNNLNNAPSRLYMNSPDYLSQKEYYSWSVHGGVKVDLNL